MKKLLLLLFIPVLFACSSDDDEREVYDFWEEKDIYGTWVYDQGQSDVSDSDLYRLEFKTNGAVLISGYIPAQHMNPEDIPFEKERSFSFLDDYILIDDNDNKDWHFMGRVLRSDQISFEMSYRGTKVNYLFEKE